MTKTDCLARAKTTYFLPRGRRMNQRELDHCSNLSWGWLLEWAAYDDLFIPRKRYTKKDKA
jgi:hypothetical protein